MYFYNEISDESFVFENFPWRKEFTLLLNSSVPKNVVRLDFYKSKADFNLGEFSFEVKNNLGNKTSFSFYSGANSINSFWKFLEFYLSCGKPSIFTTLYVGVGTVFYMEPVSKNKIRFVLLRLYDDNKTRSEINCARYNNRKIEVDIIMSKKEFYRNVYNSLVGLFKSYEDIAYFEPPYVDFDFWKKNSEIISNYLDGKNRC